MTKKGLPKCILEKWVCRICGGDKTYIDPNGHYHWFNDYDDQRNWTGDHICHTCHYGIGKPRVKKDYSNIVCCICGGKETDKNFNGTPIWLKYPNKENWNKKSYMCVRCRGNIYYDNVRKLDPDNTDKLKKAMRDCRVGNVAKSSEFGKAIISQAVVCSVRCIEDTNIEMDNFIWAFDSEHDIYGKINVKFSVLNSCNKWELTLGVNRDYDTIFFLVTDEFMERIESVWIIPNIEVMNIVGTTISKGSLGHSKYDVFRVDKTPYDNAYHNLMSYLKDNEFFGIEDIKEWSRTEKEKNFKSPRKY